MVARLMLLLSPLPLLVLVITLTACGLARPPVATSDTLDVTISGRTFTLELALDDRSRFQGLSDRDAIAEDGGMLFVFPEAEPRAFVMRRCLVPIDIAFLSPGGRIVAMHEMQVEPYDTPEAELRRYSSQWPAQFAIELSGGMLRGLGLSVGDKVDLPLEELKGAAR